jgi:hypothetical protein
MAYVGVVIAANSAVYCSRLARGAQLPEAGAHLGPEHPAEDAAGGVDVVDEIDEVAEHDQRIGPVARPGQRLGVAVHVRHHVHTHDR